MIRPWLLFFTVTFSNKTQPLWLSAEDNLYNLYILVLPLSTRLPTALM